MGKVLYTVKQGFQQMLRNRGMTLASMFAIIAMLLILGVFFVILLNVNIAAESIENDYDTIEVYLLDSTDEEQANTIIKDIKNVKGVEDAGYRSKDQALEILKKRWGKNAYMLKDLDPNPLPNAVVIKINDLNEADHIDKVANTYKGVEEVKYYKETVDKLKRITRFTQWAAVIIMAFLIIVSLVVVSNTIKLTVFARSREINIMKYVGATNWFIRGPFLAEGIIIGIISAGIAAGISNLIYSKIVDVIGAEVSNILSTPLAPVGFLSWNLLVIFIALGASIGACGSIISMRRFLDT